MPNLLEQLENNEAVLLMYLAGELAEEDQAEVEQMLTTDVQLAAELQRLRDVTAQSESMLKAADAHARLPVAESVAVRNTLRRMRQWHLEHPHRPAAVAPQQGLAYPWWAYPTSAAAMVLLAALAWWGVKPDPVDSGFVLGPIQPNPDFVLPVDVAPSDTPVVRTQVYAYADPLDQAYLELRSIQELADGL